MTIFVHPNYGDKEPCVACGKDRSVLSFEDWLQTQCDVAQSGGKIRFVEGGSVPGVTRFRRVAWGPLERGGYSTPSGFNASRITVQEGEVLAMLNAGSGTSLAEYVIGEPEMVVRWLRETTWRRYCPAKRKLAMAEEIERGLK